MAEKFPKLVILSGPEEGREHALTVKEEAKIGRAEENDVILSDTSSSRHHCSIVFKEGQYFAKDVGSRNGTFLDDERLPAGKLLKLFHLDVLRLGIYELQFLEREFSEEDLKQKQQKEMAGPQTPEKKPEPPTQPDAPPLLAESQITGAGEAPEVPLDLLADAETDQELAAMRAAADRSLTKIPESTQDTRLKWVFFTVVALCVVIGLIVLTVKLLGGSSEGENGDDGTEVTDNTATGVRGTGTGTGTSTRIKTKHLDPSRDLVPLKAGDTASATDVATDIATDTAIMVKDPAQLTGTGVSLSPEFSVFLDIKTEPYAADVFFGDTELGKAPLKKSVSVKASETYELYADFELRDLNDVYRKKESFKVKPDQDVVEFTIKAEIGKMKINKLPQGSEFYLEGYYAYDKNQANPVKIKDIVYGRPIYLPYGKYVVELREKVKVAGSDNDITVVRFQREYDIASDNDELEIAVADKDLQFFPAVIKSDPSNSEVYYSGEKVGTTPYNGLLPIGAHKLKLVKEGYFDTVIDIDMRMNAVYETSVKLTTSKMGELINRAKEEIRQEQDGQAENTLIDALKYGGSSKEKAEVYTLLGNLYLDKKDYEQAKPYFEKARTTGTEFYELATLGLAKTYSLLKQDDKAMPLVLEVLINLKRDTSPAIKNEAHTAFKKISPFKSVIYIRTEPSGATVFVNDRKMPQATPLYMMDLHMATYRIELEKPGYKTYKFTQAFKVGEFVPVFVTLQPEQL